MKKHFEIFIKTFGFIACAMMIYFNVDPNISAIKSIPDNIYIDSACAKDYFANISTPFEVVVDDETTVDASLAQTLENAQSDTQNVRIELFGIKLKETTVHLREEILVMPGGESIGVTMHTKGALVVGLGNVATSQGAVSPASAAGIEAGDVIIEANGEEIRDSSHLAEVCNEAKESVTLKVKRQNSIMVVDVTPALEETDNVYRLGMWVRDSTAGIGTLSFYVISSGIYGALGHAVTDVDTGSLLSIKSGNILESDIVDVAVGSSGTPGEIRGAFGTLSRVLGSIEKNCSFGIYGTLDEKLVNPLYPDGLPVAYPDEVTLGEATILTTIDGNGIKEFSCEIVKLNVQDAQETKGMVLKITDKELIETTGGIVQGMSGSPIIQNGKIIGAVTHVFISDPVKGYCVFALWMLEECVK